MGARDYQGPPIDGTVQHISEAPHWQGEGETVAVVDDSEIGEETVEDVPLPDGGATAQPADDLSGQTTIGDWGPTGYVINFDNGHNGYCVEVAPGITYCRRRFDKDQVERELYALGRDEDHRHNSLCFDCSKVDTRALRAAVRREGGGSA